MDHHRTIMRHHREDFAAKVTQTCGALRLTLAKGRTEVVGRAAVRRIGRFDMLDIDCDIIGVERTKQATLRDGGRNVFLVHQKAGTVLVEENEHRFVARPGSFFLLDDTRPFRMYSESGGIRQYSLHLPRADLPASVLDLNRALLGIEPHDLLSSSIRHLGEQVMQSGRDQGAHDVGASLLFNLLELCLRSRKEGRPVQSEASQSLDLYARANRLIDQNFREPGFRVAELAQMLGVSLRQLQRAFAISDNGPARVILERRLDYAQAAIDARAEEARSATITTIAYESGFNDLSYFYRAYRERFGRAPGQSVH